MTAEVALEYNSLAAGCLNGDADADQPFELRSGALGYLAGMPEREAQIATVP
jgi:hypothetical protein